MSLLSLSGAPEFVTQIVPEEILSEELQRRIPQERYESRTRELLRRILLRSSSGAIYICVCICI